jgi:tyrosyl-tRNA synthetase
VTLSEELSWRGFINQMTFADKTELDTETRTFYWGVDPSADSMHIGNLAPAMMIRHMMDHGYKAILLVGGATGMIGDPDGKKQERELVSLEEIGKNKQAIAEQYKKIFDGQDFEIVDNYDWFKNLGYLDFLREVGKHASMTQMLDREFIKARIGEGGEGISYAEFSYALIQGYDFLHLFREKGASLQVAGADQWGNSITGVSLIRRLEGAESHVLTAPLIINKSSGRKFGKTEEGAVWLNPAKTSPYKFYQFWLNVDDETAEDLIKIYTLLDQVAVEQIIDAHKNVPRERILQKALAHEVTALVHGVEAADQLQQITMQLFSGNLKIADLSQTDMDVLTQELPTVASGTSLVDMLVESKVTASNGEARRLIQNGGISIDGQKISEDTVVNGPALIKKGKNTFVVVKKGE